MRKHRAEITAAAAGPASVLYLPPDVVLWLVPIVGASVTLIVFLLLHELHWRSVMSRQRLPLYSGFRCHSPKPKVRIDSVNVLRQRVFLWAVTALFILRRLVAFMQRTHRLPRALPTLECVAEPMLSGGAETAWGSITRPMICDGPYHDGAFTSQTARRLAVRRSLRTPIGGTPIGWSWSKADAPSVLPALPVVGLVGPLLPRKAWVVSDGSAITVYTTGTEAHAQLGGAP